MMRKSKHEHEDEKYRHTTQEAEEQKKQDNDVADAPKEDISKSEPIVEVDESANSEEGLKSRTEHLGDLHRDIREDREDNDEGRLPDIPGSAIKH